MDDTNRDLWSDTFRQFSVVEEFPRDLREEFFSIMRKKGHGQTQLASDGQPTHLQELFNADLDSFDASVISSVDFGSLLFAYLNEVC